MHAYSATQWLRCGEARLKHHAIYIKITSFCFLISCSHISQLITMDGTSQPTFFEPHGELGRLLRNHLNRVPHFLFRTSAPKTNGSTTSILVQSAAAKNGQDTSDLLSRPTALAAEMLEEHCLWENKYNDNLTSWTSSFIFAIQLAIYRQHMDHDKPEPSSIDVYILDTRKLDPGTFLSAVPLLGAYHIAHRKLKHEYRHDEYFSQGRMDIPDGAMATITYQSLIDKGLHDLYPAFAEKEYQIKFRSRVNQLRNLRKMIEAPKTPTKKELNIAQAIAKHWTSSAELRPVIMATLLSLKSRVRNDSITMQAFQKIGWGKQRASSSRTTPSNSEQTPTSLTTALTTTAAQLQNLYLSTDNSSR